ncbi:hypothetical protein [Vibrio coralliirubri]|uniref:hypothetical protein n=1 Tax=Vibrio coralliirubri TaxID=1516159 RepID=UPI00067EEFA8|nr:hypothetical protein [Vibrio coralliirubri]
MTLLRTVWSWIAYGFNWLLARPRAFGRWLLSKAEPLHFLTLTLAIVIGGGWALYTFKFTYKAELAQKELARIQNEIETEQIKLEQLKEQVKGANSSNIQIKEKIVELPNGKFGLILNVLVQNTGVNNVAMSWDKTPLKVFQMDYQNGDQVAFRTTLEPKIYAPYEGKKQFYNDLFLFVGVKKELSFFVELEKEGLYYITFKAETDKKTAQKMDDAGHWFTSKYIYVKKEQPETLRPIVVDMGDLLFK